MVNKGIKLGVGAVLLCLAVAVIFIKSFDDEKPAQDLVISIDDLTEIEEGKELDSYGFNRMNLEAEEGRVKRNESLYIILSELDVTPQTIYEINKKADGVFRSNRLKPGQRYIAYRKKGTNAAHKLVLHADALNYIVFDWEDGIEVKSGRKEVTSQIAQAEGVIKSSLYETLLENGNSTLLGNRLSEIFAWQIDFFRLYPGDSFKVIYEEEFVDGKPFGIGRIVAAEFTSKNETFDAFYYETDDRAGYYDSEGNGVQKALLKAPFTYSQRVSSNFSHSRFHPVLKRRIPHYGVDYAAPLGTPVLAVGEGEVIEAQYRGANGNIVKIRHNGTYTTAYLHLNGFAKGIRTGQRVKQGEVIGYVGRTGRVTGVHLDYRIYKNNQPVNPLTVKLPPSKAIDAEEMDSFTNHVEKLQIKLSEIQGTEEEETTVAAL
jgi:murein DD-endopeptidase MepM/ murein hydrolase activator NlpD